MGVSGSSITRIAVRCVFAWRMPLVRAVAPRACPRGSLLDMPCALPTDQMS